MRAIVLREFGRLGRASGNVLGLHHRYAPRDPE
jgi:hypothetical protein